MNEIKFGDCRDIMSDWELLGVKAQMCVTSPPYFGLRDYGVKGQIGLEQTPDEYVSNLVDVFRGVRNILADDGTLWLNLGDSYASDTKGTGGAGKSTLGPNKDLQNIQFQKMKPRKFNCGLQNKQLIGIPWRVAFALQADGWYLRQDIIWQKPNCMPRPDKDRCVTSHEYIFLLAKSKRYYFDYKAIQEDAVNAGQVVKLGPKSFSKGQAAGARVGASGNGLHDSYTVPAKRNRRSVWTVTTKPYSGAHFATFPADLIEPCILAGSRPGDIVLDPFMGSGTTAQVAQAFGRQYLGCELNPEYKKLIDKRLKK